MKVFFILGSGHCGSTLLDLLLNGHTSIIGTGELATIATWNKEDKHDPFWQKVCGDFCNNDLEVFRSKKDLILGTDHFKSVQTNQAVVVSEYISVHEHLYSRILEVSGKKVVVDASKDANRVELFSESARIEPVLIHLVRDSRAVTWSYLRKLPEHPTFALFKWFLENMKIELVRRRLSQVPYIRIQYEELVRDPAPTLQSILNFADLSFEDEMMDFRAHPYTGIGGNRMKNGDDSTITEDVAWKNEMPFQYRLICTLLFGWLNWYYRTHPWNNKAEKKSSL